MQQELIDTIKRMRDADARSDVDAVDECVVALYELVDRIEAVDGVDDYH